MKLPLAPWVSITILTFVSSCHRVHAVPFGNREHSGSKAASRTIGIRGALGDQGYYNTELEREGRPSLLPFPTGISYNTFEAGSGGDHPSEPHLDIGPGSLGLADSGCFYKGKPCEGIPHINESSSSETSATSGQKPKPPTIMAGQDIFQPVGKDPIPKNIKLRDDHPAAKEKKHIVDAKGPISTNKFWGNFYLGSQSTSAFTHPYSVSWARGNGSAGSFGMAVSHTEAKDRAMGKPNDKLPGKPVSNYINPLGIQSIILSATELSNSTALTVSKPEAFSAEITLRPKSGAEQGVSFPVVQGMGFVTGIYNDLQPAIQTGIFFKSVDPVDAPKKGMFKYKATLNNDMVWLLYVTPEDGADPKMELVSKSLFRGPKGFKGTIQVAKNPSKEEGEKILDKSAGAYATNAKITGSVSDTTGTYKLAFDKAGKDVDSTSLLMFALPHHVESFDEATKKFATEMKLMTTTKGLATACVGDSWTMVEPNLPIAMDFAPWKAGTNSKTALSGAAKAAIKAIAGNELSQDIPAQTNLDSMYYSGKGLGKFAVAIHAISEQVEDPKLAAEALKTLKEAFATFVENKQKTSLVYDNVWKGIVSSGTYESGDPNLDFGNAYYNDHHFHFGYFILSAAIIGKLDESWLEANKPYVNMLVRDAGNSVSDELFPFSRAFDWFNGHSWAKGLFESSDGKDQESTSEDTMFAYAIKMWGKTSGDKSMEARGNMMLGILSRTLHNYFLMQKDNVNQPKEFVPNKVTGILFENKVDHTTYFGTNLEYIQGIHMLPLLPHSAYTRRKEFVKEEWDAMFASGKSTPADKVEGGWKGVLYGNLAVSDPKASWDFFAQQEFDLEWLDGGASRIWYMTYAAALGGGPA